MPEIGENTVQRYITDALLIDERKVHLRLYLAITSVEPLRLLLLRDALVLFANVKYDLSPEALQSKQVHLTNAAVARPATNRKQKGTHAAQDELEAQYDNGGDDAKSHLTWSLRPFLEHMAAQGVDVTALWVSSQAIYGCV